GPRPRRTTPPVAGPDAPTPKTNEPGGGAMRRRDEPRSGRYGSVPGRAALILWAAGGRLFSLIPAMLSSFHPAVRDWFSEQLGEPTAPQREGWPHIRAGHNTLIAAPTGSGKTLTAFLSAIDALLREGDALPDETRVLY